MVLSHHTGLLADKAAWKGQFLTFPCRALHSRQPRLDFVCDCLVGIIHDFSAREAFQ